jgi:hypothetical protein
MSLSYHIFRLVATLLEKNSKMGAISAFWVTWTSAPSPRLGGVLLPKNLKHTQQDPIATTRRDAVDVIE